MDRVQRGLTECGQGAERSDTRSNGAFGLSERIMPPPPLPPPSTEAAWMNGQLEIRLELPSMQTVDLFTLSGR